MDILITGANSGIGFEAAKQLLYLGHVVHVVCRSKQKTDETVKQLSQFGIARKAGDVLELDDLESVKQFAAQLKLDKIDCLINNAGIMALPNKETTKQGYERQVGVNFVAHYLLSRLLVGKLLAGAKASGKPSRIVNVSSDAHLFIKDINVSASFKGVEPYHPRNQYSYSKILQIWDTAEINEQYASQSSNPQLISLALHPGVISTNLARHIDPEVRKKTTSQYTYISVEDGAKTTVFCATASLEKLKCSPPLKEFPNQALYYRDSARAEKMTPLTQDTSKFAEMKKVMASFSNSSKL